MLRGANVTFFARERSGERERGARGRKGGSRRVEEGVQQTQLSAIMRDCIIGVVLIYVE